MAFSSSELAAARSPDREKDNTPPSNQGVSFKRAASSAASRSCRRIGVELALDDFKSSAPTSHAAEEHRHRSGGLRDQRTSMRPGRGFLAAEPRYRGAKDGRRLGLQAAADRVDRQLRQGGRRLYSTALNQPRRTTFCSMLWPGFHQHGPPISAYKFKPPARGESFISCSAPPSPFLTIAFFSLPNSSATNRGSCHPFLKTPAARFPGRHLSLSLSLPWHSDIPTF